MTNQDFEKLDSFMKAHQPGMDTAPLRPLTKPRTLPVFGGALATLGLAALLSWSLFERQRSQDESVQALVEIMSWDVTSDEMPQETSDVLDDIELST